MQENPNLTVNERHSGLEARDPGSQAKAITTNNCKLGAKLSFSFMLISKHTKLVLTDASVNCFKESGRNTVQNVDDDLDLGVTQVACGEIRQTSLNCFKDKLYLHWVQLEDKR